MTIAKGVVTDILNELHEVMNDASQQSRKSTQRITASWHAGVARGIALAINSIVAATGTDQEFTYTDDMSLEAVIMRFRPEDASKEPVQ